MISAAATLLVVLLGVSPIAARWGYDMHRLGARIAEDYLTNQAASAVDDVLGGDSLEDVSTWADEIRNANPWSETHHYINTDDWECHVDDAVMREYCGDDNCIVGAVHNYTDQLLTGTRDQEDALKFLVHYMGDIHQPLHAGFADDLGGNTIDVYFYGSWWNLHALWDTGIPGRRESELGSEAALENEIRGKINGMWAAEVPFWRNCTIDCAMTMASESAEDACDYAYDIEDGDTVSNAYYNASINVFERRIAMYAIRLAELLNEIFA